jgi:uncharacterized protein
MSTSGTPATNSTDNKGRFVWHELMTNNAPAAKEFYTGVIGWSTVPSNMPGMDYTLFTAGEIPVAGLMEIQSHMAAMNVPPSWGAYLEVPDVDATIAQAQKLGAVVDLPATFVENVGKFAVLHDPQGAVFGIITSAMPLPPETDPAKYEFSWHELSTSDPKAAILFYEQLFGWKKQSEFDMGDMGVYHMFGRDRFTYGGIMAKSAGMPAPYWLHYIRVVDTADAAVDRAKKAGAKVIMGPMEVPGGDRVAVMTDPQGAVFAVHSKD